MIVIKTKNDLRKQILVWKSENKTIGFCPTMGTLHAGHLELVKQSKKDNDLTIVSIFINPTQFNDPKDFEAYPVQTDSDLSLCKEEGVDLVFLPTKEVMYPEVSSYIEMSAKTLEENLCGKTRPGHFNGVLQVVSKLFNLVLPDRAYFGLKDYQQYRIIQTMAKELDFPLEVIGVATKRESDGLAMSSRNLRLSEKERDSAKLIPRMWELCKKLIHGGERDLSTLKEILTDFLLTDSNMKIDYLDFVDPISLQLVSKLEGEVLIAIAVFVGPVRLIDNQMIEIS